MTIEEKKQKSLQLIREVEEDIEVLQNNIKKAKDVIQVVKTEEDAKKYSEYFDLENGLKHIELF